MTYHTTQCPLSGRWQVMYDDGTRPHGVYTQRSDAESDASRRNHECSVYLARMGSGVVPEATFAPESSSYPSGAVATGAPRTASGTFVRTQELRPGVRSTALVLREVSTRTATGST